MKSVSRIDMFRQMTLFYDLMTIDSSFTSKEVALYYGLIVLNNKLRWKMWFSLPLIIGMEMACCNQKTFYSSISLLEKRGLIKRKKGTVDRAQQINIVVLTKKTKLTKLTNDNE